MTSQKLPNSSCICIYIYRTYQKFVIILQIQTYGKSPQEKSPRIRKKKFLLIAVALQIECFRSIIISGKTRVIYITLFLFDARTQSFILFII